MKRILVACGNGIATSTVVASKIKDYANEKGYEVNIDKTKLLEVRSKGDNYDLVVTTGNYEGQLSVPIVKGMPLLTGIGQESTLEEIFDKLNAN